MYHAVELIVDIFKERGPEVIWQESPLIELQALFSIHQPGL